MLAIGGCCWTSPPSRVLRASIPHSGELCLCAITRFEVLYSARSPQAFEELEEELDAFHELRTDDDRHRLRGSN